MRLLCVSGYTEHKNPSNFGFLTNFFAYTNGSERTVSSTLQQVKESTVLFWTHSWQNSCISSIAAVTFTNLSQQAVTTASLQFQPLLHVIKNETGSNQIKCQSNFSFLPYSPLPLFWREQKSSNIKIFFSILFLLLGYPPIHPHPQYFTIWSVIRGLWRLAKNNLFQARPLIRRKYSGTIIFFSYLADKQFTSIS